jgi:hypothetical protein
MKLAVICIVLVVGLIVQVSIENRSYFVKIHFEIQLQSNSVDAIFWQFIKPFLPVYSTGNSSTSSSSGSSGSASTGSSSSSSSMTSLSASSLNQSNAILTAGGSTSVPNITQNFGS